jgi:hypothetical protein
MCKSNDIEHDLWDRIHKKLSTSKFGNKDPKFLAKGMLKTLITEDTTREAIGFYNMDRKFLVKGIFKALVTKVSISKAIGFRTELDSLVTFVVERAEKVFATLVSMGLSKENLLTAIRLFKEHHFDDSKLPIEKQEGNGSSTDIGPNHSNRTKGIFDTLEPNGRKFWKPCKVDAFYENQWKFLAPIISTAPKERQTDYDLSFHNILPFIFKDPNEGGKGSFGEVNKYMVHHDHFEDPTRKVKQPELLIMMLY